MKIHRRKCQNCQGPLRGSGAMDRSPLAAPALFPPQEEIAHLKIHRSKQHIPPEQQAGRGPTRIREKLNRMAMKPCIYRGTPCSSTKSRATAPIRAFRAGAFTGSPQTQRTKGLGA